MMQISGSGPVDGFQADLSSARGEIHGQTALAIMSDIFLKTHNQQNMPIIMYGDNIGVQQRCKDKMTLKLRDHRQPNHDLYLEYHNATQSLNKKVEWVKGHQDNGKPWKEIKDLEYLDLTPAAYLNIWCDATAAKERTMSTSIPDADTLPSEEWAVYSCYPITKKLTGRLEKGIHDSIYTESLREYL